MAEAETIEARPLTKLRSATQKGAELGERIVQRG